MVLPYKNADLSVDERVNDLLARMSVEEKVAQLTSHWMGKKLFVFDEDFNVDKELCKENLVNVGHIGKPADRYDLDTFRVESYRTTAESVKFVNEMQAVALEVGRLEIPLMCHDECLHGLMAAEATCFPQAIALASSWDLDLVERVYSVIARETRSSGTRMGLAPVLDVARDPRWGRVDETFGEDPYLVGEMGVAAVCGMQGRNLPLADDKVFATLKHFIAHSAPEGGRNLAPVNFSDYQLRETFLPPFEKVIRESNVQLVMPSFNEINGLPVHANEYLLKNVLREELGFDGLVVSDYMAVNNLTHDHCIAGEDHKVVAAKAYNAGVDLEFGDRWAFREMVGLIEEGKVDINDIDRSVANVLRLKFVAGLFESPYEDEALAGQITNNDEARAIALEAAHKSCILLKNQNRLLPLSISNYKKIAVIGPNADEVITGGYSADRIKNETTIFEGIKNKVGDDIQVAYKVGVKITDVRTVWDGDIELSDKQENLKLIEDAVNLSKESDLVVLVLGENETITREAWHISHPGDSCSLDLVGQQEDLLKAVLATGKSVVLVLNHARPLTINYAVENVPAILDCWYLGQETGNAVADILFGDVNPSGRLPITMPRSVGQLPMFYNRRRSSMMPYLFAKNTPLFPFGFGLSYTTFEYSEMMLSSETTDIDKTFNATVTVTNTGDREGVEVVQLYINDVVSSRTRPYIELKGFQRITLRPGESKDVVFNIGFEELSYYLDNKKVVEPGEFQILIGPDSSAQQMKTIVVKALESNMSKKKDVDLVDAVS